MRSTRLPCCKVKVHSVHQCLCPAAAESMGRPSGCNRRRHGPQLPASSHAGRTCGPHPGKNSVTASPALFLVGCCSANKHVRRVSCPLKLLPQPATASTDLSAGMSAPSWDPCTLARSVCSPHLQSCAGACTSGNKHESALGAHRGTWGSSSSSSACCSPPCCSAISSPRHGSRWHRQDRQSQGHAQALIHCAHRALHCMSGDDTLYTARTAMVLCCKALPGW